MGLLCNDGTKLDGGGHNSGSWTSDDYKTCPGLTYFCGVQPRGDKNAVNQLRFLCCRPNKDGITT